MKMRMLDLILASGLLLAGTAAAAQDEPAPAPKTPARAVQPGSNKIHSATAAGRAEKAKLKATVKAVDVNRASKDELKKLPGITDAMADKIIAGRPYLTKSRLVTENIIPMMTFQAIRDRIAAVYVTPAQPLTAKPAAAKP